MIEDLNQRITEIVKRATEEFSDSLRVYLMLHGVSGLTVRQKQVLEGIVLGKSNKEIAADYGMSYRTTKFHVSNLLKRCGVDSRNKLKLIA